MKTYPHLLETTGITIEKNPKRTKDDQNGPRGLFGFAGLLCPWNHKRNPTITAIYSICEALGLSPLEFFKRVTDELNELNKPRKNLQ